MRDWETSHPFLRATRHHSRNISRRMGERMSIPILLALTLFDPDDHSVTIDIGELQ